MSFKFSEGAGYSRQTFNPEEITDGRPRVVTFTRVSREERREMEVDRENPASCELEGLEEGEQRSVFLRMLGDLQSETLVLLGKPRRTLGL